VEVTDSRLKKSRENRVSCLCFVFVFGLYALCLFSVFMMCLRSVFVDRFYIALFSALEQTQCARMFILCLRSVFVFCVYALH